MNSSNFEIRSRRPLWQRILFGISIIILVAAGSYLIGYGKGGSDNAAQRQLLTGQEQQLADQAEVISRLKRDMIQLEQGRRVDEVAIDGVRAELKDQQQEMLELREEIAFYRGIVSPSESRTGILIQRFELSPLAEEGFFQYRLVLTQVLKNERVARGVVDVFVAGVMDGRSQRILLKELVEEPKPTFNFRFKYFQMFEGSFELPEGFIPHSVEVEVKPRKSRSSISESFPWIAQSNGDEL